MQSEDEVQQRIRMEAPTCGSILLRNNSGVAATSTGRPVRFGLGNDSAQSNENFKSSDLIGITTITITPEMVGRKIGVFTAVEVKDQQWKPNKKLNPREQAQQNFIDFIRARGGFAGFANSIDSFRKIIGL